MAEFNRNVWAPWRMSYIETLDDDAPDAGESANRCFLCNYFADSARDAEHYVLWRSKQTLVVLNRYPYSNGHLLVAPAGHVADFGAVDEGTLVEMMLRLRNAQRALAHVFRPDGYNIGANLGRCAGAGLPGHLHWHIVPRWGGDTNFMTVVGDARVIPQALEETYTRLRAASQDLGLPA